MTKETLQALYPNRFFMLESGIVIYYITIQFIFIFGGPWNVQSVLTDDI